MPASGDTIVLYTTPYSAVSQILTRFAAGVVPAGTQTTLSATGCAGVPAPPPGATCVSAFNIDTAGVTSFPRPVRVTGNNETSLKPGTLLLVAQLVGGAWVDVITAMTGVGGAFRTLHAAASLPGIRSPGTFLVYQPAPGAVTPVADFGIALVPDDGNGTSGLQIVSLYADDGSPFATPILSSLSPLGGDLDGSGLTPDGSEGVMVDGSNSVVFFSGIGSGVPLVSRTQIDVTNFGGDGDAIAISPNGDEAIVSADGNGTAFAVITGIASGQPTLATSIPETLPPQDGLAISNDGTALLARGQGGLSVFSIAPIAPVPGPLGGTVSHSYTHVADFTVTVSFPYGEDGRDGMGFSPLDSSRAVVVGTNGLLPPGAEIQLITGMPGTAAVPPLLQTAQVVAGATWAAAVAVTPDGTRAVVGTDAGLVMFSGVDTGALAQVGPPFNPSFTNKQTTTLAAGGVPTLGITLDGNYVVAMTPGPGTTGPDYSNGTILMIPISGTTFGAPVGQLNGVAVPNNDQIMMH
jgi:hypothetical protein